MLLCGQEKSRCINQIVVRKYSRNLLMGTHRQIFQMRASCSSPSRTWRPARWVRLPPRASQIRKAVFLAHPSNTVLTVICIITVLMAMFATFCTDIGCLSLFFCPLVSAFRKNYYHYILFAPLLCSALASHFILCARCACSCASGTGRGASATPHHLLALTARGSTWLPLLHICCVGLCSSVYLSPSIELVSSFNEWPSAGLCSFEFSWVSF